MTLLWRTFFTSLMNLLSHITNKLRSLVLSQITWKADKAVDNGEHIVTTRETSFFLFFFYKNSKIMKITLIGRSFHGHFITIRLECYS